MTEQENSRKIDLTVQGMTCAGCEPRVVRALEELPGVKKVQVSHPESRR